MSRRKRSSRVLDHADRRLAAMRSISLALDLGNGLTLEAYTEMVTDLRLKLGEYNTVLSKVDQVYNDLLTVERTLADFSEQMLLGVGSKYSKNSNEYEMAGGVRKVDRKRRSRGVSLRDSSSTESAA